MYVRISQRKLINFLSLQARPLLVQALVEDNYSDIVDPRLANNYNPSELKLMVACASACVRRLPQARPPMSQVCNSFTKINHKKLQFSLPINMFLFNRLFWC
jgi:hypothetical protein